MDSDGWCEFRIFPRRQFALQDDGCGSDDGESVAWLHVACCNLRDLVKPFTSKYLWQGTAFDFAPATHVKPHDDSDSDNENENENEKQHKQQQEKVPHLWGRIEFGDCLDDEWFVVSLLFELTRRVEGLVAEVWDVDGQFLLIESALVLPKWLKPQLAKNRVFICDGCLHIVPLPSSPADIPLLPSKPSLVQALSIIRGTAIPTEHTPATNTILQRLQPFPHSAPNNQHLTTVHIPWAVAHVLDRFPNAVALAVTAFYSRDVVDMKACQRMKFLDPRSQAMVFSRVRFTRCLYAQLCRQDFVPPPAFRAVVSAAHPRERGAVELGMKLTCGFEMLCAWYEQMCNQTTATSIADLGNSSDHSDNADTHAQHVINAHPTHWQRFQSSLENLGYFGDNLVGSNAHKNATRAAAVAFAQWMEQRPQTAEQTPENADTWRFNQTQKVVGLLREWEAETHDTLPAHHDSLSQTPSDDSDAWMYVTESELENMLRERAGVGANSTEANRSAAAPDGTEEIDNVVKSISRFVDAVSSHEGVETHRLTKQTLAQQNAVSGDNADEFSSDDYDSDDSVGTQTSSAESDSARARVWPQPEEAGDGVLPDLDDEFDVDRFMSLMHSITALTDQQQKQQQPQPNAQPKQQQAKRQEHATASQQPNATAKPSQAPRPSKHESSTPPPATTQNTTTNTTNNDNNDDDLDDLHIDYDVAKNILQSFEAQHGMVGPVSNLLAAMGVTLKAGDANKQTSQNWGDLENDSDSDSV